MVRIPLESRIGPNGIGSTVIVDIFNHMLSQEACFGVQSVHFTFFGNCLYQHFLLISNFDFGTYNIGKTVALEPAFLGYFNSCPFERKIFKTGAPIFHFFRTTMNIVRVQEATKSNQQQKKLSATVLQAAKEQMMAKTLQ